jgi:hypothetical protein
MQPGPCSGPFPSRWACRRLELSDVAGNLVNLVLSPKFRRIKGNIKNQQIGHRPMSSMSELGRQPSQQRNTQAFPL